MNIVYPVVASKGYSAAANLGEVAGVRVQGWMGAASLLPLVNANQLTSLSAMIAYIAMQSGQSEFRVERRLADRFSIPNAKCLPASQFDIAIRYLVDAAEA